MVERHDHEKGYNPNAMIYQRMITKINMAQGRFSSVLTIGNNIRSVLPALANNQTSHYFSRFLLPPRVTNG